MAMSHNAERQVAAQGRDETWFAVLPDCDAALVAARRLPAGTRVVPHASGRPWLVGTWPTGELCLAADGEVRLAVLGRSAASAARTAALARELCHPRDVDRVARACAGENHLLASIAGEVRVQGSLSGLRRVFHTEIGEVGVASDRADVLALADGRGVDPARLAMCLLAPEAPYPFEGESLWSGVEALPEDHYLWLGALGMRRVVRWWEPPEATVPLAEAAEALRDTLCAVVGDVRAGGRTVTCDLSGGLDSTPLCYLAARGAPLTAVTTMSGNPGDDDPEWADLAAAGLPGLERLLVPAEDLPLPYDGIACPGVAEDDPYFGVEDRADVVEMARFLSGHGSQVHLTGNGGDEVLQGTPAYLYDLVRTHPFVALSQLRGYRALFRWPWRSAARLWTDRSSCADWLTAAQRGLTDPPGAEDIGATTWGMDFRLPPWATASARDLVGDRLADASRRVVPLAATRGQHDSLVAVHVAGYENRRQSRLSRRHGVNLVAPYLDDRVVEICLAVRPHERTTPWRYKPLIVEAMRGIVPDASLARATKAEGSDLLYRGLRAHRDDLHTLFDDMVLERLGLVDAVALRHHSARLAASDLWPVALSRTISCERWLRDLETSPDFRASREVVSP
jgi:asparagine synthase (glutamine-hydrolysing)